MSISRKMLFCLLILVVGLALFVRDKRAVENVSVPHDPASIAQNNDAISPKDLYPYQQKMANMDIIPMIRKSFRRVLTMPTDL
ncbi:hypothetical protein AGMMS49545_18940 [Betaproteobacteria bacterium]|nr:hypothetical protein AGMMS49545_18940 [Betaproteobacteria bacterium]GHU47307.1 hypothetical protein AGMMS50289_22290 [Betaproteobacteria bacterium]